VDNDESPILTAIVTGDRIAFDAVSGDYNYTITLRPAAAGPSWWTGEWRCKTDNSRGHASARLYRSADGGIVLVGNWKEDYDYTWITELRPN
jgi:hypothetical protein